MIDIKKNPETVGKLKVGTSASTETLAGFTDSQAAIVGGDNVGLALQSTNSNKSARVRFFDHSGNQDATVGFDNSTSNLFLGTGTAAHLTLDQYGNAIFKKGTGAYLQLSDATAVRGSIHCTTSDGLVFSTGSGFTQQLAIDNTGLATFNNGIAFQSATTGTGTGVGHTLENYEYGTFTMGLSGTTATIPSGNEIARYYRIGNLVWISWYSGAMTLASSSGAAELTGLPFNVANNTANYSVFSYAHGNAVDGNSHGGYFIANATTMRFIDAASTAAATFIDGSSKYIMVTGVYETDDA